MLHTPINNNVPSGILLTQVLDCDMSVIQQSKKSQEKHTNYPAAPSSA